LVLFKFLDSHCLTVKLHVEDSAIPVDQVAFLTDLDHGADNFVLDEEGVEAEVRKLVGEVVVWDLDLTEMGHLFWGRRFGKEQVGGYHVFPVFIRHLHCFFHYDLVHGALEVLSDFPHQAVVVRGPVFEVATGNGH
jgi:hypothetical protein